MHGTSVVQELGMFLSSGPAEDYKFHWNGNSFHCPGALIPSDEHYVKRTQQIWAGFWGFLDGGFF